MSTVIVTTREDLAEVLKEIMPAAAPMLSAEASELEILQRKQMLTTEEVEKLYGLSASTLRKQRVDGEGPGYIKHGRLVFYSHQDIKTYMESGRIKTYA